MFAYDYSCKIVLVGECSVGKKALTQRLVYDMYNKKMDATIGVDYSTKILKMSDSSLIKLQMWDTAGQENFISLIRTYYKDVGGAIIIFDLCDRRTFNSVHFWYNELKNRGLGVTLTSAYRPLSVQNRLSTTSTEPGRVAEAGTSAHGWGGAIDLIPFSTQSNTTNPITNLAVRQTDLWKEVAAIGAKYGWYNPKRLSDKAGVDEAWHFEYWASENVNE